MQERGMYYLAPEYIEVVRSVGGIWTDKKRRPVVCLIKSAENEMMYWAIPMGNYKHRDEEHRERINRYISLPEENIGSCFYHIGRTTAKSIFFISDVIPITEKYIESIHKNQNGQHYIIKNRILIEELERKLKRILSYENANKNIFRQHITDIKEYLLRELETQNE